MSYEAGDIFGCRFRRETCGALARPRESFMPDTRHLKSQQNSVTTFVSSDKLSVPESNDKLLAAKDQPEKYVDDRKLYSAHLDPAQVGALSVPESSDKLFVAKDQSEKYVDDRTQFPVHSLTLPPFRDVRTTMVDLDEYAPGCTPRRGQLFSPRMDVAPAPLDSDGKNSHFDPSSIDLLKLECLVLRMEAAVNNACRTPNWLTYVTTEPSWSIKMRTTSELVANQKKQDALKSVTYCPTSCPVLQPLHRSQSPSRGDDDDMAIPKGGQNVEQDANRSNRSGPSRRLAECRRVEAPRVPQHQVSSQDDLVGIVRSVLLGVLPAVRENANEVIDEAMRPWLAEPLPLLDDVVHGTPVPFPPTSAQSEVSMSSVALEPKEAASAISQALLPHLQKPLAAEIVAELVNRHADLFEDTRRRSGTHVTFRSDPSTRTLDEGDHDSEEKEGFPSRICSAPVLSSQELSSAHSGGGIRSRANTRGSDTSSYRLMSTDDSGMSDAIHRYHSPLLPCDRRAGYFSADTQSFSVQPQIRERVETGDTTETGLSHEQGLEHLPRKAFVINFQRLIFMRKLLQVIHEFINSTVVASLTLVKVGSLFQLIISLSFMVVSFVIYSAHYWHYDTLEISDYKDLCDLLGDDDDICHGRMVENPNRLIKALSFSRYGRRKGAIMFVNCFSFVMMTLLWSFFSIRYFEIIELRMDDDDKELTLTLMLVGTMVILLHLLYEWIFWRETQCIMPPSPKDPAKPWDPREHGLPLGLRWFGLPSMWFTSEAGAHDLRLWISKAKGLENGDIVHSIYPQEMAILALDQERCKNLSAVLRKAKLYDAKSGDFLHRNDLDTCEPVCGKDLPEDLGIDLVYFDAFQHVRGQANRGEYLQSEEAYTRTVMRRVTERGSQSQTSGSSPARSSHRPSGVSEV